MAASHSLHAAGASPRPTVGWEGRDSRNIFVEIYLRVVRRPTPTGWTGWRCIGVADTVGITVDCRGRPYRYALRNSANEKPPYRLFFEVSYA